MPPANRPLPPDECAQCGEPIPRNARACPECGADERTGWRESSIYDGLDLPDDSEDENEFAASSQRRRHGNSGLRWYWVATLIVVLIVLGLGALGLLP